MKAVENSIRTAAPLFRKFFDSKRNKILCVIGGLILIVYFPHLSALAGLGAVGLCIFIKKKIIKSGGRMPNLVRTGLWSGVGVFVLSLVIIIGAVPDRQNRAIARALAYDNEMSKRMSDSGNRVRYLSELRKIPLGGCPYDFAAAYRRHIAAWRADDKEAIKKTWQNVILVAYDHGVDCEKYITLPSSSSSSGGGLMAASALLQILAGAVQQQGTSYNQQQNQWQSRQQQQRQLEEDSLREAALDVFYPNRVPYYNSGW